MRRMSKERIKIKALEKKSGKRYDLFMIDFTNEICRVSNPEDPNDIKTLNIEEIEIKFLRES